MRKLSTSLLLIALISGCGSVSLMPQSAPEREVVDIEPAIDEQRRETGEPVAEMTVDVDPDIRVLYTKALEAMAEDNEAVASALLFEITEQEPQLAGAWVNLSILATQQNDPKAADEYLTKALTYNPNNCDALSLQGVRQRVAGMFNDAEASYMKCLEQNPYHLQARLNLGILYELYMGRFTDALVMYQEYQLAQVEPDTTVRGWMMDLERRVASLAKR
ncbi:MAG: hypothetical protein GKR90_12090 [Pseudomonadales bacterium]|nr:hypothetical protein [Pseudomonadales bacterium]